MQQVESMQMGQIKTCSQTRCSDATSDHVKANRSNLEVVCRRVSKRKRESSVQQRTKAGRERA